jgi:hypothetical protein
VPGEKPTKEQLEERIERTREMLASGLQKRVIKRRLAKRYGVNPRTCETYLARARELIVQASGRARPEWRAESLAFYESVIADRLASTRDKVKARERIDKLLGLEDKSTGNPLEEILATLPPDLARALRGALAAALRPPPGGAGGGAGAGP